jgi:alpha-L-fucosidase
VKSGFSGGKLTISPPAVNPATNPCDFAWVFKIENSL